MEEVQKLTAAVAEAEVTANDWLLRDFFVAVDDFRARHQVTTPSEWIRLSVPMNLRREADNRMPAANVVSMVFLDRTPKQIANSTGLLASIHEEMELDPPPPVGPDLRAFAVGPALAAGRNGEVG